jgi:hypothetical protein
MSYVGLKTLGTREFTTKLGYQTCMRRSSRVKNNGGGASYGS